MSVVKSKILESYKITRDGKDGKSGLAVIFAFEKFATSSKSLRDGTDKEVDNLRSLFTKMNLRVHVLQDLKLAQVKCALRVITKPPKYKERNMDERFWQARLTKEDSVSFIAVTSHGDSNVFQVYDGKMEDKELEEFFYSDVCSILEGCPKLFLYNKCRDILGVERYEIANEIVTDGLHAYCDKDIMAIYTCAEGVRSLRSTSSGSLVLSYLSSAYEAHGKSTDIVDFIKSLNNYLLQNITEQLKGKSKFPSNVTQVVSVERDTTCKRVCFLSPDKMDAVTQQNPSGSTASAPVYPIYSATNTTYDPSYSSTSPDSSYDYSHSQSLSNFEDPIDLTLDSPTSPIPSFHMDDDLPIVIPYYEFSDTTSPHKSHNQKN